MNITTFGNSKCAQNLIKILEEENNPNYQKLVSRFLIYNNKIIKEIAKIEDNEVKMTLCNLFLENIKKSEIKVPKKILTHAINILVGKIRTEIVPTKEKKIKNMI